MLRLGSLEEASSALRSYLDLMGVSSLMDTNVVSEDPPLQDDVIDQITDAKALVQHLSDNETLENVIHVLLAGIQLYGDEEQHGVMAVYLSDLALDLLLSTQNTTRLDQVYRARGSSYGLIAMQSGDHILRAKYHEIALSSFSKAIEINPTCWKTHYCRGLQQAIVRDTQAAIQSLTKSIELYPENVEGWHLLGLLYSCRRTNDLSKSLMTLEAGILQQSKWIPLSAQGRIVYNWDKNEEMSANQLYEQATSFLSIRLSLLALKQVMYGPDQVLDGYQELFGYYTKLIQQLGISFQQEEEEEEKRKLSTNNLIRRTSSTSTQKSTSNIRYRRRSSSMESRVKMDSESGLGRRSQITVHRSNSTLDTKEIKNRQIQLMELGLAKRIGSSTPLSRQGIFIFVVVSLLFFKKMHQ